LYHQKCYADLSLNVSKEDFEKPENLTIELDCSKAEDSEENPTDDPVEEIPDF
jgi:penicillin-binding protein 1A